MTTKKEEVKVFDGDIMNMFVLYCESDGTPLRLFKMSRIEYTKIPRSFIDNEEVVKVYTGYEEKDLKKYLEEKDIHNSIAGNVGSFLDIKELF